MKRNVLIMTVAVVIGSLVVGSLLAFGVAGAFNAPGPTEEENLLTVQGVGVVKADPNKFSISFTIWTQDDSARKAQQDNDTKANALIAALKDYGIGEDDLATTSYRLDPVYEWEKDSRKNRLVGYKATYTLLVTVYDLKEVGAVIDLATSNGVNQIGSISYQVKEQERLQTESLRRAMRDAKSKAEVALGEYDLEVKIAKSISLMGRAPIYENSGEKYGAVGGRDEAPGIAPEIISGDYNVVTYVIVVFRYGPKDMPRGGGN